ncbi:MAG TPA: hypothetical protein VMZ03_03820 [Chitinophagaceae bacterium]|nr:hypothetical protein [Chitinophagaceae bacterium]
MNAQRKKAALAKYQPQFTDNVMTNEELKEALAQDDKKYTVAEINEIVTAITGDAGSAAEIKKSTGYEEWKCEVKVNRDSANKETSREPVKLKKLRPCVKITEQEVETLNNAALNSPRHDHVIMYFLPE